jgi:hypothetical protein
MVWRFLVFMKSPWFISLWEKKMNNFKKLLIVGGLLATTALVSGKVIAATDGTLGATSTGTSVISVTIAAVYQITGLADYAFGTYGGVGAQTINDDVCVYTNDAAAAYNTTMVDNSEMTAGAFQVETAANTAQIAYTVDFNDVAGVVGTQAVAYNTPLASTGANTTDPTCTAHTADNANIRVNFTQAALQAAPAGAYSATLSTTVGP